MSTSKYLIIGSSHAGLSALDAIRLQDTEGSVTMVTREKCLPYSPTILPYVVSGQTDPGRIFLRSEQALDRRNILFVNGKGVTAVNTDAHSVTLSSGENLSYEKLLLATGATPVLPPIAGLEDTPHHVLRTLDDALRLRDALNGKRSAVVIGAGLIGMHAAENLVRAGMAVTIVEALPRVLYDYFDEAAAGLIQKIFGDEGVALRTDSAVKRLSRSNGTRIVTLESGEEISGDLVLVSTGARPVVDYLTDAGIAVDMGIVVDRSMRTSAEGVWAAGDVAQAPGFFDSKERLNGTLLDASEQGRIAGMDMAGDPARKPYKGGISMNAYTFFGRRAFSIGLIKEDAVPSGKTEAARVFLPEKERYRKLVFQDNRLVGIVSINTDLDPGVMFEIVRRKTDLKGVKSHFAEHPRETGRILMTKSWR